jgi:hypothetical protein
VAHERSGKTRGEALARLMSVSAAISYSHFWMIALKTLVRKPAGAALLCTLLFSLPFSATELKKVVHSDAADFIVYLNAAYLVRAHRSADIYDSADTGEDPQLRRAAPDSVFAESAVAHGIADIGVYVYPPFFADTLLPLTPLSPHGALQVWRVCNVLALIATALLLAWLFGEPALGLFSALAIAAVLLFRTDLTAIFWEQATILLLLLTTAGIVFYAKGWIRASAIAVALAAAIKLTPGILVLPLLFWAEWRWLRWFAAAFLLCVALTCAVNGPAVVADFFLHVMPPMSNGTPGILNCSLPSAIQMFGSALAGVKVEGVLLVPVPHALVIFSKAVSLVVLVAAYTCLARRKRPALPLERATILALIALLGVAIAPVSWRHAYTIAVPVLFLLWSKALRGKFSTPWLFFLCFATVEFGFIVDTLLAKFLHGVAFSAITLIGPCCALALIFHQLCAVRTDSPDLGSKRA